MISYKGTHYKTKPIIYNITCSISTPINVTKEDDGSVVLINIVR